MRFIDTHTHLDVEKFASDVEDVISRAKAAGASCLLVPGINISSVNPILDICRRYPGYVFPMAGLHPEEVKSDWQQQLDSLKPLLYAADAPFIAIGEVGLDFYWSREFEAEQLKVFEQQVIWSVETRLPLMIHCRKAQNEMVHIMRHYEKELPGGVFHCFTGNAHEASELLSFDNFVLGIGGVLTFKKSHLPEVLPANVPLDRIVLETDSPYMAPVPMRGKRNESSFVPYIIKKLAECYSTSEDAVADKTCENVVRIFPKIKNLIH